MKKYNLRDGLQAIKDAWFFEEDLLISPWYYDEILVANNETEKHEGEGILDYSARYWHGHKVLVKKKDFSNVDDYLNHLEQEIQLMAEGINSDVEKRKSKNSYLHLMQLAFAIRERLTLQELYATKEMIQEAKQKVEDYAEEFHALDAIYCDYHKNKDLTFKDHIVVDFVGSSDSEYHFCDKQCAERFFVINNIR